eukprot:130408-Amorphochlora_amoeboformis.AAC.1
MNKSNQQRVEKWKAQKVVEWEKGGKLREKYETREELDKWMEGQINKAKKRVLAPKAKNPKVLVRGKTSNDPEVTWEDQQNINAYGRLNQRMMELEDDIKAKKKLAQEIEDGIAELEALIDDDACKILIGECYVQVSNEEAEEFVEEKKKLADAELSVIQLSFRSCIGRVLMCVRSGLERGGNGAH